MISMLSVGAFGAAVGLIILKAWTALAAPLSTTLTTANVLNVDLDGAAGSDQLVCDGGDIDLGGATLDINVVANEANVWNT